jgi:hypothetical protein
MIASDRQADIYRIMAYPGPRHFQGMQVISSQIPNLFHFARAAAITLCGDCRPQKIGEL